MSARWRARLSARFRTSRGLGLRQRMNRLRRVCRESARAPWMKKIAPQSTKRLARKYFFAWHPPSRTLAPADKRHCSTKLQEIASNKARNSGDWHDGIVRLSSGTSGSQREISSDEWVRQIIHSYDSYCMSYIQQAFRIPYIGESIFSLSRPAPKFKNLLDFQPMWDYKR